MAGYRAPALCLALAAALLGGCAAPASKARLYNIGNDMLSTARFYQLDRRFGRLTLSLPDGEQLRGEFTLTRERAPAHSVPEVVRLVFSSSLPKAQDARLSGRAAAAGPDSLAGAFGYKRGDVARPAAVATAVGDRGTAMEIVLYTLDLRHAKGTGIAHDNHGNWYLVRLGI